jgi:glycosyltransferase involved in cell wall biosynthesis
MALDKQLRNQLFQERELLNFSSISINEYNENMAITNNKKNLTKIDRVVWFLPELKNILQGGVRTIFHISEYMSINFDTLNIFVVYNAYNHKIDYADLDKKLRLNFPKLDFFLYEVNINNIDTDIEMLPSSDLAICTLWTTAYLQVKYNLCTKKCYFTQDYEPNFYSAGSVYGVIEATYRLGYDCIANTKGVYDKCIAHGGKGIYFEPGIDHDIFYQKTNREKNKVTKIVFYGRPNNDRNGFTLGIEILKKIKEELKDDVEIISVGTEWDEKDFNLDGIVKNLGLLKSLKSVADLYRECDFGLCFMFTPHPSYQPLEYMACGCIPIVNKNISNEWLLKDNYNCIVVEPIIDLAVEKILNTLSSNKINITQQNLSKSIENFTWEKASKKILGYILEGKVKSTINIDIEKIIQDEKNDFLDFGCSNGESLLYGKKGLEIDIDSKKVDETVKQNLLAILYDI